MQTLGQRVSELIAKSITTSSTPLSEDDISGFLKDGVRDFTARILVAGDPNLLSMLTTSKTDVGTGISIDNGYLVAVIRNEAAASTTENPASVISASLRGRAADVKSLFYQSHYNPVYYILDGVVHTLPTPTSATDYSVVSYVSSETAINGTSYNVVEITNFPKTYSGLIVYYASAMACMSYSSDVHSSIDGLTFPSAPVFAGTLPTFSVSFTETLPVEPSVTTVTTPTITLPSVPVAPAELTLPAEAGAITLPTVPTFVAPTLTFSFTDVNSQISNEDMDLIEKQFEKIDKNFTKFDKDLDIAKEEYSESLNEFNKEFDRLDKNNERTLQGKFTVFRENLSKYERDIGKYQAELSSYTAEVQKYVADVNKFEKEGTVDIALFAQKVAKYNASLSKYQSDVASFQAELARYNAEVAVYQADLGKFTSEIQAYSIKLNRYVSEYQWYTQRYQLLYNQYLAGIVQAPAQQQQQQAQA